jgi:hypothetical protein
MSTGNTVLGFVAGAAIGQLPEFYMRQPKDQKPAKNCAMVWTISKTTYRISSRMPPTI